MKIMTGLVVIVLILTIGELIIHTIDTYYEIVKEKRRYKNEFQDMKIKELEQERDIYRENFKSNIK